MPQEQQNIRRWLVRLTGPIFIEMVLIILLGIVVMVLLIDTLSEQLRKKLI